jgi:hypothetical protein
MRAQAEKTQKQGRVIRVTGASLYGKYVTLLVTEKAVEVYVTSTLMLVIGLWVGATFLSLLSLLIDMLLLTLCMAVAGGILGFFLARRLFKGRQDARFVYDEIASFVKNPPDFNITTRDGRMYSLRMLPKKQVNLISAVSECLQVQGRYSLEKIGTYYRLVPVDAPEKTAVSKD